MKKAALAFLLILTLSIPTLVNAQVTSYYGRREGDNPAAFTLTIYSPNNQTGYGNTMLLKFNITWTTYVGFPFPIGPSLKGDYAYSIDNNPRIPLEPNQSASDLFYYNPNGNFTINPYFSYLVSVSNLANGYHKIVIIAGLYRHSDYYYINQTTSPTQFLIQNSTATPTPGPTPSPIQSMIVPPFSAPISPSASTPTMVARLAESASALNYGSTINFTVSPEDGTQPYTFEWYLDGQLAENSITPYFSTNMLSVGSHNMYVKVSDSENNSAKTLTVSFEVLPLSSFSTSPSSTEQLTLSPTPTPTILADSPDMTVYYALLSLFATTILITIERAVYLKTRRKQ